MSNLMCKQSTQYYPTDYRWTQLLAVGLNFQFKFRFKIKNIVLSLLYVKMGPSELTIHKLKKGGMNYE